MARCRIRERQSPAAAARGWREIYRFPIRTTNYGEYMYWHTSADSDREIRWLREQVVGAFSRHRGNGHSSKS